MEFCISDPWQSEVRERVEKERSKLAADSTLFKIQNTIDQNAQRVCRSEGTQNAKTMDHFGNKRAWKMFTRDRHLSKTAHRPI